MGSESDFAIMKAACEVLNDFGVSSHVEVVSAHRTPRRLAEFAESAHEKFDLIIAAAGGAAHLPGMIASSTPLPVIGVPISLRHLDGLDSLLSIVQMPKGIPVATVAIDNASNAALLAVRILALGDLSLRKKIFQHFARQKNKVRVMNKNLKKLLAAIS